MHPVILFHSPAELYKGKSLHKKIIQLLVGTSKEILWQPDGFEKFHQMSQLQNRKKLKFPLIGATGTMY